MKGTIITNRGLQLLAKLSASGNALTFSRSAVGTGSLPAAVSANYLEDLIEYKMDGKISACSAAGDTASVTFQLSSADVKDGFTITEAGIYAADPNIGEILYSYMDMSDDPQYMYSQGSANTKILELTLEVVVGQTASVTAYINPNSLVTKDGGDISDTIIETLDYPQEPFPIPMSKEKSKGFLGKVKKNLEDWKNFKDGIITLGKLVNNGQCTESGFALDARYGKTLAEMIAQLNSNLMLKIRSGSLISAVDKLSQGKYAGYYTSDVTDTPSAWGTFEVIVLDNMSASIIVTSTSTGNQYINYKTSNTWSEWQKVVTNSDYQRYVTSDFVGLKFDDNSNYIAINPANNLLQVKHNGVVTEFLLTRK